MASGIDALTNAAAAIALSVVEAAIPLPLPGVKPGLANIIALIVLARYGWREAVWVSLLRVVAGSLLLGLGPAGIRAQPAPEGTRALATGTIHTAYSCGSRTLAII